MTQQKPTLEGWEERLFDMYKRVGWVNKLSDYSTPYKCDNDCVAWGCPGHEATFSIGHASDIYHIKFHDSDIRLDPIQLGLILNFAERIEERHIQFIRTLITAAKEEGRAEERKRILDALPKSVILDKRGGFTKVFWGGYNQALNEVLKIINP